MRHNEIQCHLPCRSAQNSPRKAVGRGEAAPARVRRLLRGAAPTPRKIASNLFVGGMDGEFDGTEGRQMHDVTCPPAKPQKALGVCIYCGGTSDLTDEHVVPFGLAKNSLILPKASCKACAALTSLVEMGFLREGLGILREKFGSPTRRGKRRTGLASRWLVERAEDGAIAHGVAVVELGLNAFRPFLKDVILKDNADPFQYVGGAGIPDAAEGVLHAWEQGFAERPGRSGARYVIVLIRLFAFLGAPQYLVVAGDQSP